MQAFAEVEIALVSEGYLRGQEGFLEIAAEQARAASRLADDRYRSGLTDIITVLAAQRRALETESALLTVRRQRLAVRVDLLLALGGGFEDPNIPRNGSSAEANSETREPEEDEES